MWTFSQQISCPSPPPPLPSPHIHTYYTQEEMNASLEWSLVSQETDLSVLFTLLSQYFTGIQVRTQPQLKFTEQEIIPVHCVYQITESVYQITESVYTRLLGVCILDY